MSTTLESNRTETLKKAYCENTARVAFVHDVVSPFAWVPVHITLTAGEANDIAAMQDAMESGEDRFKIPAGLWRLVSMPHRCLQAKGFATLVDAKAMAIALMPTVGMMNDFLDNQTNGISDDQIGHYLADLQTEIKTDAGTVLTQLDAGQVSIWFGGRKAGRQPSMDHATAISAVRLLFNLPEPRAKSVDKLNGKAATRSPAFSKGRASQSSPAGQSDSTLQMVRIDDIVPAANNHRKTFDKAELKELADSIKQHGILQPLLLRPRPDQLPPFQIIAGERRFRAAQMAGLADVPAQISDRSGLQASAAMFEENIRRVDLTPIERAQAIQALMESHELSQKEVGKILGVQQGQISNELRLLKLPSDLQKLVADGTIAPTLIREILPVADFPKVMDHIAKSIDTVLKNGNVVESRVLKDAMRNSVVNHSRSMKYVGTLAEYQNPNSQDRHFSKLSPEDERALDVREFKFLNTWDGQLRTFNLELFGKLNQKPLQQRREKHAKWKESRRTDQCATKSKSGAAFLHEWTVQRIIESDLTLLLADAIEQCKDKANARLVCLVLLVSTDGDLTEPFLDTAQDKNVDDDAIGRLLHSLNTTPAGFDSLLRKAMLSDLRGNSAMETRHCIRLGKQLGVDLVTLWKPTDELLEALTDAGRQQFIDAGGQIPDFLRPFFGLPKGGKKKVAK